MKQFHETVYESLSLIDPFYTRGSSLQEEILSVCLFVRHHFFLRVNRRDILQKVRQFFKRLEPDFSNSRQIRVKSVFANFKHKYGPNMFHRVHFRDAQNATRVITHCDSAF